MVGSVRRWWFLSSVALAVCLTGVGTPAAVAQDVKARFKAAYIPHTDALVAKFATNRKVRYEGIGYAVKASAGRSVGDIVTSEVWETVAGSGYCRTYWVSTAAGPVHDPFSYLTPHFAYTVKRGPSGALAIHDLHNRAIVVSKYESARLHHAVFYPMALGANGRRTDFILGLGSEIPIGAPDFRYEALDDATWMDVRAARLRLSWTDPMPTGPRKKVVGNLYFDPANDYAALGSEVESEGDPSLPEPHKKVTAMRYEPSPDGYPLPKRRTQTVQFRTGPPLKLSDITFLSYEPFTPAADEFRLEERFGLTTPVGPGETPPPTRIHRSWPWWVLAVGLVLGVGTIFYRRLTSAGTKVP